METRFVAFPLLKRRRAISVGIETRKVATATANPNALALATRLKLSTPKAFNEPNAAPIKQENATRQRTHRSTFLANSTPNGTSNPIINILRFTKGSRRGWESFQTY